MANVRRNLDEFADDIAREYVIGASLKDIATKYGVHSSVIRRTLVQRGVKIRPPHYAITKPGPKSHVEAISHEIVREYVSGASFHTLRKKYHAGHGSIKRVLERHGVMIRPQGRNVTQRGRDLDVIRDEIVSAYLSGASLEKLEKHYHVNHRRLSRFLRACGIAIRGSRPVRVTTPRRDPTPEEIAERCAEIQATWSEVERRRRLQVRIPAWSIPEVRVPYR